MKNFKEFLIENTIPPFDKIELRKEIVSLGIWLTYDLGMKKILEELFTENNYYTGMNSTEKIKFEHGLQLLKKTNISSTYIDFKLRESNLNIIRDNNGNWDFLSKVNTNYQDIADILVYIIEIGYNRGAPVYYESVMENPKVGLLSLKPILKRLIHKFFIENGNGINNFRNFSNNSRFLSNIGDRSEDKIADYLESKGFTIIYRGGNGDFIDMLFGVDMIVYHPDYSISSYKPYITIQVKTRMDDISTYAHYKVDWVASPSPARFFSIKTGEQISI